MTVKLAQIGVGNWGKNLLRNFASIDDVELSLVCDSSEQGCRLASADPRVKEVSRDWRIILDRKDITAVVIATPPQEHYRMAKACLENGKDVFVEKPITLNVDEAVKLAHLADTEKKILMVILSVIQHPISLSYLQISHHIEFIQISMIHLSTLV